MVGGCFTPFGDLLCHRVRLPVGAGLSDKSKLEPNPPCAVRIRRLFLHFEGTPYADASLHSCFLRILRGTGAQQQPGMVSTQQASLRVPGARRDASVHRRSRATPAKAEQVLRRRSETERRFDVPNLSKPALLSRQDSIQDQCSRGHSSLEYSRVAVAGVLYLAVARRDLRRRGDLASGRGYLAEDSSRDSGPADRVEESCRGS